MPVRQAVMAPLFWASLLGATPSGLSPVELTWDAPASCPARGEVVAKIEGLLGHPLESPAGIERVEAHVLVGAPHRLDLVFWRATEAQHRSLEDAECAALAEAAALIIAIAIDPEAMGEPPPPPPPPRPRGDGLSAPDIPFDIPYARIGLSVFGGADLALGRAGPDLGLGGAVLWSSFRFELVLARAFARTLDGGSAGLWSATASACLDPLGGWLELPICPGISGAIYEITPDGQPIARQLAFGPALSASLILVPIPNLGVRALFEGVVPFGRPAAPDGSVLPAIAARGLIGVEVRFP